MIKKIRHTGIVVNNLDLMFIFYKQLGFSITKRLYEKGDYIDQIVNIRKVNLETVKLQLSDKDMIELLKYHNHPHPKKIFKRKNDSNEYGWSHVAFTVDSIQETINTITENGGSVLNSPSEPPNGNVKVAYCHDPEGNIIELVEETK